MSIWISFFDLSPEESLGAPYEVDYPNESIQQPDFGLLDLAKPMSGFPQGWVRVSIDERPGVSAECMLSPDQVRALHAALGKLITGSAGARDI